MFSFTIHPPGSIQLPLLFTSFLQLPSIAIFITSRERYIRMAQDIGPQIVGAVCSVISSIACFTAAVILFVFKRKSKVLFRLELGLCIALGMAHLANFFLSLPDLLEEPNISFKIAFGIRVVMLGGTIHYVLVIYINFLLNTLRWTQERMIKAEKWFHLAACSLIIVNVLVYIRYYTAFVSTAKNTLAFSLSFICTEGAFIVIVCILVNVKQRRMFEANSEVLSPLVTARSKKSLESFLRRLSILTVVSCLIFLQVLLFIPEINKQVNAVMHTEYVSELFSLDGLLVSLLLTSTPNLVTQYKKAYGQWRSSYQQIPVSPYFTLDSSTSPPPKRPVVEALALSTKQIGLRGVQ